MRSVGRSLLLLSLLAASHAYLLKLLKPPTCAHTNTGSAICSYFDSKEAGTKERWNFKEQAFGYCRFRMLLTAKGQNVKLEHLVHGFFEREMMSKPTTAIQYDYKPDQPGSDWPMQYDSKKKEWTDDANSTNLIGFRCVPVAGNMFDLDNNNAEFAVKEIYHKATEFAKSYDASKRGLHAVVDCVHMQSPPEHALSFPPTFVPNMVYAVAYAYNKNADSHTYALRTARQAVDVYQSTLTWNGCNKEKSLICDENYLFSDESKAFFQKYFSSDITWSEDMIRAKLDDEQVEILEWLKFVTDDDNDMKRISVIIISMMCLIIVSAFISVCCGFKGIIAKFKKETNSTEREPRTNKR